MAWYAHGFSSEQCEPDPADDDVWDDVVLVVSEAVAVGGMWVFCGGGRVMGVVGLVWGILVGEVGWVRCVFLSTVCQVVEELGEVEEGELWVSRKGLPGLDAEMIVTKVYVVCPLGEGGGG